MNPAARPVRAATTEATGWPLIPMAFVVSLLIPVYVLIGSLNLSMSRLFLLLVFPLTVYGLVSKDLNRGRILDLALLGHVLWVMLALAVNHGFSSTYEGSAIYILECFGAYLVGRVFIRSAKQFRLFVTFVVVIVVLLSPFFLMESLTGQRPLREFFSMFGNVPSATYDVRAGLVRAWGVFNHSILLGVFCASLLSLAIYVVNARSGFLKTAVTGTFVVLAGFTSLSSATVLILVIQLFLSGFDIVTRTFKKRWMLITSIFATMYVALTFLSNRGPFGLLVSYASFNTSSAYNRIRIWQYGTAEVYRHPIFGIGLNDWQRPEWMVASVDNFWLYIAMRYGLPGFLLIAACFVGLTVMVVRRSFVQRDLSMYRRGWVFCMLAIIIAGGTVHFFGTALPQVMLLLGAGAWMIDVDDRRKRPDPKPIQQQDRPAPVRGRPIPLG